MDLCILYEGRRRGERTKRGISAILEQIRSPTHKSQPDAGGGVLDEREVVGVVLFEASGDSSEVLNLVEEALDEIAEAMKETTEGGDVDAPGHWFDIGPGSASGDALAQGVAVVGTVTEENLTFSQ